MSHEPLNILVGIAQEEANLVGELFRSKPSRKMREQRVEEGFSHPSS